jgi:hypothetical protein
MAYGKVSLSRRTEVFMVGGTPTKHRSINYAANVLGLAVAWSGKYPGWLGWVAVVAGVGTVPVGLVQAFTGESIGFTRIATIIFPTIITLWVAGMSVLLWRQTGKSR